MSPKGTSVVVTDIIITTYNKVAVRNREYNVGDTRLTIVAGPQYLLPKIRLRVNRPSRHHLLEPIPGKGQAGHGVSVEHNRGSWSVCLSGRRIAAAVQAAQAHDATVVTILAALQPLREYVERSFHFTQSARPHKYDF